MRRSRKWRVVKPGKLVERVRKSVDWFLKPFDNFLCEIIHVRGKRLHLSIYPESNTRRLGFGERERFRAIVAIQVQRFGLAVEEFVARGRGIYCRLRVAPMTS